MQRARDELPALFSHRSATAGPTSSRAARALGPPQAPLSPAGLQEDRSRALRGGQQAPYILSFDERRCRHLSSEIQPASAAVRQQQRRVPLGGDQVGPEEGAGKGGGGGGLARTQSGFRSFRRAHRRQPAPARRSQHSPVRLRCARGRVRACASARGALCPSVCARSSACDARPGRRVRGWVG